MITDEQSEELEKVIREHQNKRLPVELAAARERVQRIKDISLSHDNCAVNRGLLHLEYDLNALADKLEE